MNTAVINVKVDQHLKKDAQKIAEQLGFNLSVLINGYLRQLVRTKAVQFSLSEQNPSQYFLDSIEEAEKDIQTGKSMSFDNKEDAVNYLHGFVNDKKRNG